MHSTALKNRAAACIKRVLRVSCAEAVEVQAGLHLEETVVDAIVKIRPEAPSHDLAVGPAGSRQSALKQHAEMSFQARPQSPGLIRRFDHHAIARTKFKSRQCRGRCGRFFLELDLL